MKPDDIDDDTWRKMVTYCGKDPTVRRVLEVEVLSISYYDGPWTLAAFGELIESTIARVPPEHCESAVVDAEGDSEWWRLKITYKRPENADEIKDRVARVSGRVQEEEFKELATYERLKRKFAYGDG